jgi:hypothetical protein
MDTNTQITNKETRQQRFRRVAARRTNEIIDKLRILGNCANRSAYAYTDEEVNKIFAAIEKELREFKSKFARTNKKRFSL